MSVLELYFIFFKIGLFTVGGGLAALPLMQREVLHYGWMTMNVFSDMIAVSQSTPGPIGVNMATYIGYHQAGIMGSIIATLGLVTPSIIIICIIAKFLDHFNDYALVKNVFYGLRPAVIGLIVAAAYTISKITIFAGETFGFINPYGMILFIGLLFVTNKWKLHPIVYIIASGIFGIILF